jgi:peptidoglycan-associated lipoprotein
MPACSHKKVAAEAPDTDASASSEIKSSDLGNAYGLMTIHFGYDSDLLSADAKNTLKQNAKILKDNPGINIQIEGHCDQRGGIQYNVALGERRANSVKHFLVDLGVQGARISTISYGKERLLDTSDNEAAYAKNRRANFVITKTMG